MTSHDLNQAETLNLPQIIDDLFLVLTDKEREVITKRFRINNEPLHTLEKIGQKFSVTRERIRQIEKIALNKLRRTALNTSIRLVIDLAHKTIEKNGGIMLEDEIVSHILNEIYSKDNVIDGHIIRLALHIDGLLIKAKHGSEFRAFWYKKPASVAQVRSIVKAGIKFLKKENDLTSAEKIVSHIQKLLQNEQPGLDPYTVVNALKCDNRVKEINQHFGLMAWRHVNPRSIRDKAYVVLKNKTKPLHFVEIANAIGDAAFDKKTVTTQAVHNELIRCELFVLVGRGLYALKEWGYQPGTVADIIRRLLKENGPMSKKDIIAGVLKQRKVKKGTISLNLQKVEEFKRVGRAVYELDM